METVETLTRIKICGITNSEDAIAGADYGADALGFIAVYGTPRFVHETRFKNIAAALPPYVTPVLVAKTPEGAVPYDPTYVQHYSYIRRSTAQRKYIRVFRIANGAPLDTQAETDLRRAMEYSSTIQLDTLHPEKLGGVGEPFDWEIAAEIKERTKLRIILAGGLTPENVQDAIARVRPYAVDVSSGVESEPGRKDHEKLRAFIRAVQEWDLKYGDR